MTSPDDRSHRPTIRSAAHPLVRQARELARGIKQRREHGMFLIEGSRALQEALASQAPLVWVMVAADSEAAGADALRERSVECGATWQPVEAGLLRRIAPTEHGPGLLAACRLPADCDDPAALLAAADRARARSSPLVILWQPVQPGNVGVLVRSAAAFGACGVVSAGGADPWNEKAIRASAGAVHRVPIARGDEARVGAWIRERGARIAAAVATGGAAPRPGSGGAFDALLLGSETSGLPVELTAHATRLTLPLDSGVESLGVAMAGTVLLALLR